MHDELEKFVKRNREAFDDEQPGEHIWEAVQRDLRSRHLRNKKNYLYLWRAAAVFLFLSSAWLMFDKLGINEQGNKNYVYESAEMQDAEQFYFAIINEKRQEVVDAGYKNKRLESGFFYDLNALDSAYSILKSEMKLGNSSEIEDAMILNLQIRVEILNKQLDILKALKNEKTHENRYL